MLKINKIYKVKEGHEGKCEKFQNCIGATYIMITTIGNSLYYNILENNKINTYQQCNCFTEDDLELEEKVKVKYKGNVSLANPNPEAVLKVKSLEDLEVRRDWKKMLEDINELVDNDFGFDLQFDEKEYTDKDVDKMRKIILSTYQISHCVYCKSCQNKYKYQISKQMSPSEAETLLEERLGIKVKIK